MKNHLFAILLVSFTFQSYSQGIAKHALGGQDESDMPVCGSHHLLEHIDSKLPGFLETSNNHLKQVAQNVVKLKKADDELLEVKVVFHVVYHSSEENIPDSVFINQMKVLNESFSRTNADTSNMRTIYNDIAGNPNIKFTLATEDPEGNPTNGIVRDSTDVEYFGGILPYAASDPQIKILEWLNDTFYQNLGRITDASKGGSDAWDTDEYLNIWIGDLRIFEPKFNNYEEILFYALATPPVNHYHFNEYPLGAIHDNIADGVLMHFPAVGPNNPTDFAAPYGNSDGLVDQGETLVHEVGHYLGLRHIWGDGDCTADDFVDDTPTSSSHNGYSCSKGKNTCVDSTGTDLPDMVENFMDYSTNACVNSFTKGQVWVMRETVKRGRTSFVSVDEYVPTIKSEFTVYPNPSNGSFILDLQDVSSEAQYRIIDTHGRLVAQGVMLESSIQINMNSVKGVYYLEVIANGVTQRKRVVML
jgi:hypothetical protein